MDFRLEQSDKLLNHIKEHLSDIESLYMVFLGVEEGYIYRFYHQSYKIFGAVGEIKRAVDLFERIAPTGCH